MPRRPLVPLPLLLVVALGSASTPTVGGPSARAWHEVVAPGPVADGLLTFSELRPNSPGSEMVAEYPDGRGAHILPLGTGVSQPAWSTDGRSIAYVRDPSPGSPSTIMLADAAGENRRALTDGYAPSWSPSGSEILFVRSGKFWVIPSDGTGSAHQLTVAGRVGDGSWSPDGTRIAFSGVVPDPARTACSPHCGSDVYVMNADGTDLHDIAPWPKNQAEGRWSPDGNWIATSEFSRQSSGPAHDRVFIVHPDGSGRLEASGSASSGPSFGLPLWSPGRAILAWPANEVSVHGLAENGRYEFDPATGNIRFVNLYAGDGLAWQPLPCTAWGTSGNDVVAGTVGDDVLCGLAGNDTFDPRGGNDVVVGGAGDDTVTYRRSPAGIIVDLSEATVTGWGENALLGVENVVGSRHDDTILGDRGANRLAGGPGDDEVDGGRQPLRYVCGRGNVRLEDHAADLVQGDAGDDVLRGAGPDRLNGGAGTDRCAGDQASDSCEVRVIPPPPPGPPAPVPATPHHDGRIAFVDEAGDLLSVRPDGSDRHMLFRASQRELFIDGPATWAPQGRRFVLTGDTGTAEHPIGHTYVFRSDGTEVRELHGISCCPQWAPDGTNLVFLCRSHLWLVGVGGSQAARLGAVEEYGGTLAPDGRSVAYPHHVIGRDGGHWEIWTMRPDGTGRKPLTRLGGFNDTPLWSPDGTRLLFIHEGKTQGRYAEVIDADGSRVRRLPIPTWDFAWAPDGRRIVYQAESGAILTSRLDGSDPVRVGVNRILGAADVSWQPGSPIHP